MRILVAPGAGAGGRAARRENVDAPDARSESAVRV
jgi:hypothetical protein